MLQRGIGAINAVSRPPWPLGTETGTKKEMVLGRRACLSVECSATPLGPPTDSLGSLEAFKFYRFRELGINLSHFRAAARRLCLPNVTGSTSF